MVDLKMEPRESDIKGWEYLYGKACQPHCIGGKQEGGQVSEASYDAADRRGNIADGVQVCTRNLSKCSFKEEEAEATPTPDGGCSPNNESTNPVRFHKPNEITAAAMPAPAGRVLCRYLAIRQGKAEKSQTHLNFEVQTAPRQFMGVTGSSDIRSRGSGSCCNTGVE